MFFSLIECILLYFVIIKHHKLFLDRHNYENCFTYRYTAYYDLVHKLFGKKTINQT